MNWKPFNFAESSHYIFCSCSFTSSNKLITFLNQLPLLLPSLPVPDMFLISPKVHSSSSLSSMYCRFIIQYNSIVQTCKAFLSLTMPSQFFALSTWKKFVTALRVIVFATLRKTPNPFNTVSFYEILILKEFYSG